MAITPLNSGSPVKILDEGIEIVGRVASIDFVGSGVTGTNIGNAVTETIPGGGSFAKETPVGTIDGLNKVFTVTNTPKFVVLNGAVQNDGGNDYTLTVLTITFVNAPPAGSTLISFY